MWFLLADMPVMTQLIVLQLCLSIHKRLMTLLSDLLFPKECMVSPVHILTGLSLSYSCQLLLYLHC